MKLTLASTNSGYNLTPLNNNFSLIEAELQNKVLYRDNPDGEPNQMEQDIDLNSNNLLNVNELQADVLKIAGVNITTTVNASVQEAENWAVYPEDSPVPEGTGTQYSSYHYSLKGIASAGTALAAKNASEAAQAAAELALYNFDGTWYGVLASEPVTDPNGDPVSPGDIYVNSTDGIFYFYNGGVWNPLGGDVVGSIYGRTGFVTAQAGDYTASEVDYENGTSGLTATNVQAAIDEVEGRTQTAEGDIATLEGSLGLIAPEIASGAFNPDSPNLIWSGNATSVPVTVLSDNGPGWYIARSSGFNFCMYVMGTDATPSGGGVGATFHFGPTIYSFWLTEASPRVFLVRRYGADGSGASNEAITQIWKV